MKTIFAIILATLSPLGALSAQKEDTVVTSKVPGYDLGQYASKVSTKDILVHLGGGNQVVIVGRADATPFGVCGKNTSCSTRKNQTLAELRASKVAQELEAGGASPSNIITRGEVSTSRGAEFRGVDVYIVRRNVVAITPTTAPKNDSLANIAKKVELLDTALTQVSDDIVQLIMNRGTVDRNPPTKVEHEQPFIDLDVGAGVSATQMKEVDSFTPTLTIFIQPKKLPFEVFLEGGYRPAGRAEVCSRADVSWAIGIHKDIRGPLGLSGGLFTDREACTNGGHKLAEKWLERTNGVFVGPTVGFTTFRLHSTAHLGLTYGETTMAEDGHQFKGFGLRAGFDVRIARKH